MSARPFTPTTRARWVPRILLAAALLTTVVVIAHLSASVDGGAATIRRVGTYGRVLGVRNWFGTYDMGDLGVGWCIDPGVPHAPDPDLGYVPDPVAETDDQIRAAMAWASGSNHDPDPVSAAATTLVLHDLLARPYAGEPLNVDTLEGGVLSEFEFDPEAVVTRAREIKADALAHSHLRGPFTLTVEPSTPRPGELGDLVIRLTDSAGWGVAGVEVSVGTWAATLEGDGGGTTDGEGVVRFRFTAAEGRNQFAASATFPSIQLAAFVPTGGPGQRVVVPQRVTVEGSAGFEAVPPPGIVQVDKRGDVVAYLPLDNARFEVWPLWGMTPAATLVTAANGRTPDAELSAGHYRVVEAQPPAGYDAAPPQEIEVRPGQRTEVVVFDTGRRGSLRLRKEDGVTHDLVAGATFELTYDADHDGHYERPVATLETGEVELVVPDLPPGDYQLTETEAPAGYAPLSDPVRFTVEPGESTALTVQNSPRSTVGFAKEPDAPTTPEPDFSGAVFVVRTDAVPPIEAGRCTTARDGTCHLPAGALSGGSRYCWSEEKAPAGWGLATGGCFTAIGAGRTHTVKVTEPRPPSTTTTTQPPPSTTPPTTAPPTTPPTETPPPSSTTAPPSPPRSTPPPVPTPPHSAGPPALPRTGSAVLPTAVTGLLLVGAGAGLARWSRRRNRRWSDIENLRQ